MAHSFIEASSLQTLKMLLNGGVQGGAQLSSSDGKVDGLHNLTLIINTTTVTFSDANGAGLPLVGTGSIKGVIELAVAGVTVTYDAGRLVLHHATGVTVDKTGTANSRFGFTKVANTVGIVYGMPGDAAPSVVSIGGGVRMDSYFAHVEVT